MFRNPELVLVIFWNSGVLGLICHCDFHCPDDHKNFTCETDYKCFTTFGFEEDGSTSKVRRHGCMPSEHSGGMFQCRGSATHQIPMAVLCCKGEDMCNLNLHPTIPNEEEKNYLIRISSRREKNMASDNRGIALVISITISVSLLVLVVTYLYFRFRQISLKRKQDSDRKVYILNGREPVESMGELLGRSSGTGAGIPILTQRTIGREITLYHEIGHGRFGTVFKGRWKQQLVAVKTVNAYDELSWQREQEMYQTAYLCHENILGFIAADVKVGMNQEIQRLLITAYHSYGSLFDFLQNHSFGYHVLYRIASSAISGLSYIHRVIYGSKGKPSIAHRDIKSKNILVKEDLQCCIADFGLAIKIDSETKEIDFGNNTRLPTIRYMSPEMLKNPENINFHPFDTYQKADIYAFGLVLWEVTRRYEVEGVFEEYSLPYSPEVGENPTIPEMSEVVCTKQLKLVLPPRYDDDPHAKAIIKLMNECWHHSPSARLTALRVKKTLQKCLQDLGFEDSRATSTGGTASTGIS